MTDEYTPPLGAWIRWTTTEFGREGQVVESTPPSIVVKWLGVETPQVFPWAWPHFTEHPDMEFISKPPAADRIERERLEGRVGITEAAARLGIEPKRVRQRLRDGKLRGIQHEGRWTHVIFDG